MNIITFITSNALKLKEVKAILKNHTFFKLVHHFLELPELQASPDEISINKCLTAAAIIQGPVLVEDTTLAFNGLNGLPGPYIKAFISQIGLNGLVRILSDFQDKTAKLSCTFAYTEGPNKAVQLFTGTMSGKIITPSTFTNQMHWDAIFQPDGFNVSYAMMEQDTKNKISHRYRALMLLIDYLKNNYT